MDIFSFAEQAKLVSERFRDQPLTPIETAKHWVKHVAKNKGAPHLRSAAVELPFYALYNIDIWAFISIVFILTFLIFYKLLKLIISFIFVLKEHKKTKKA